MEAVTKITNVYTKVIIIIIIIIIYDYYFRRKKNARYLCRYLCGQAYISARFLQRALS